MANHKKLFLQAALNGNRDHPALPRSPEELAAEARIVIGVFGTLLLNLDLPALAKYPVLIVLTYGASNLGFSVYRSLAQNIKSSRSKSVSPAVI